MISKLEQEFYRVFEISPATVQEYGATYFWDTIEIDGKRYTPIDDHKLLQLIIIRATNYNNGTVIELEPDSNIEDLKYEVLKHFIDYRGNFDKYQIQQLFKD